MSEPMKIEPGCMAIIINTVMGHNGVVCEVIRFIGEFENAGNTNWEINVDEEALVARESQLMRIDGFKEEDIENEIKLVKNGITELTKRAEKQMEELKINIDRFANANR